MADPKIQAENATKNKGPVSHITKRYILLVMVALTAGFGGGYFGSRAQLKQQANSTEATQQVVLNESQLISNIAKTVGPSVVSIDTTSQAVAQSPFGPVSTLQQSAGTGIIISSNGYIVTNRHVVPAGTKTVNITLADGTRFKNVEVIGRSNTSSSLDVAFLKIGDTKGKKLVPAKLGDSSEVRVGDKVVAIGNALGEFQNTVTSGIISGFDRSVQAGDETGSESLQNLFQTDAAINQGNSGGPLVNINGEVIAINTAIAGGTAQNIGFAIPINDIRGLIDSILKTGAFEQPYLGVRYITLTPAVADKLKLDTTKGAYILPSTNGQSSIMSGSPAEAAGLKEKDIITKVDDTVLDTDNNLTSVIGQHSVGDEVTLTIIRDGKEMTAKATLKALPES